MITKIEIKNCSVVIKEDRILHHVDLVLKDHHIYGLVGRNGSGKSMLLKMLSGFVRPTEGTVYINEENLYQNDLFPQNMGILIERPEFIDSLTGFENLKLLAQINKKISDQEILVAMKKVNILAEKDKQFRKYSLGTKQKLGIAQVLMEDPDILLLDEPFNGLEEESAEKIRNLLKQEKERGKLIILATHMKEDIESLCDTIYRMDGGEIIDTITKNQ